MTQEIIDLGNGFWNIRGSFKIAGMVDLGTQASLVQLASGKYVLLDACNFTSETIDKILALTEQGEQLESIINLHPFHTLHVAAAHQAFPNARLYGTERHHQQLPELPWQPELTESDELQAMYSADLEFSIPKGVEFVSDNENVHFSSVLAWHAQSKTIHVDDTLVYMRLPLPLRLIGHRDTVRFHPTLSKVLLREKGATDRFTDWAQGLIESWGGAENLCAAHVRSLTSSNNNGASIADRIENALERAGSTLAAHKSRFG